MHDPALKPCQSPYIPDQEIPELIKRIRDLGARKVECMEQQTMHFRIRGNALVSKEWHEVAERVPAFAITVTSLNGGFKDVLSSAVMSKTYLLELTDLGLDDDDAVSMARSPRLRHLRWLDLSANQIERRGVCMLAKSTGPQRPLEELCYVDLSGNPCDPIERFTYDQESISDVVLPEVGREIEEEAGRRIPWLHRKVIDGVEVYPDYYVLSLPDYKVPGVTVAARSKAY